MADNVVDLSAYTDGQGGATAEIPVLTLGQLREQAKRVKWLVKHVVPAESIGMFYGGSGTFKSFIALDFAMHVAHGLKWLNRKTTQGPVLFIAAEGGTGMWPRIVAWHRARRLRWQDAPVLVIPMAVDLISDAARVQEKVAGLVASGVIASQPVLVVIDTMSQTFSGEENSAAEVAKYLREIGLWFRNAWQAAVLVVHHTGHNETERARGSSAIRSNVDWMYSVWRDEKEMLATLECVKLKDDELFEATTFSLRVLELDHDEDGEPIKSLAASALTDKGEVLDAMEHEAQRGRGGRNQLFLDLAVNGIEEKKLRTVFCEAIDGEPEKKRKAYFRARKWALDAGVIEVAQGTVIRLNA